MLSDDDAATWEVLEEDGSRLMHVPENGRPRCGYDGKVTALTWPTYAVATWCARCVNGEKT